MATTHEDFTFPTFPDPFSSGIDSPPLWRLSPCASPDHHNSCHSITTSATNTNQEEEENSDDQEEEFKDCFPLHKPTQRKSFSWVEKGSKHDHKEEEEEEEEEGDGNGDEKEEEKMDMLWEDFNEELSSLKRSHSASRFEYDHDHDHMINIGCAQSLRLSKTSSAMVSPKKQGFVVFIHVLKKLFLLHNSHHRHSHMSVQTHRSRNRRAKNRSW